MGKRKKVASVMFTGAVAATTAGAGATPVAAQPPTWHFNPGGPITIWAYASLHIWSGSFDYSIQCTSAHGTGSLVTTATGASPRLGTINASTLGTPFVPCSLYGVLHFIITLDNPIGFFATGFPSGGVTPGRMWPFNATMKGVDGFDCSVHITGWSVPGAYHNNRDGVLAVNHARRTTLYVDRVDGCSIGGLPCSSSMTGRPCGATSRLIRSR